MQLKCLWTLAAPLPSTLTTAPLTLELGAGRQGRNGAFRECMYVHSHPNHSLTLTHRSESPPQVLPDFPDQLHATENQESLAVTYRLGDSLTAPWWGVSGAGPQGLGFPPHGNIRPSGGVFPNIHPSLFFHFMLTMSKMLCLLDFFLLKKICQPFRNTCEIMAVFFHSDTDNDKLRYRHHFKSVGEHCG